MWEAACPAEVSARRRIPPGDPSVRIRSAEARSHYATIPAARAGAAVLRCSQSVESPPDVIQQVGLLTGLAFLHRGETVIPAGGGFPYNDYSQTIVYAQVSSDYDVERLADKLDEIRKRKLLAYGRRSGW